ncbi:MAG TPA: DUF1990 domain-containing protein [Nocardioides sp.]|nr:DUF1990 domain-containing protein [Nocardioides sp.]
MELLDPVRAEQLRALPLTYDRPQDPTTPGTTPGGPAGFGWFSRTLALRRTDLDGAADDLLSWRVHERAGLRVRASGPAVEGAVVEMRLGLGPAAVRIPCRVVAVVAEPDRRGFSYGTLPGHPERGEEQFLLERAADGSLRFTVSAFSRPATRLARLGGPVTGMVQRAMTDRYLRAPDRLADQPAG